MKGKTINQTIACVGILTILVASTITTINGKGVVGLFAHSAQLEILYDFCIPEPYTDPNNIGDSEDEKWYMLDDGINMQHIGHSNGPTEIKYHVYDSSIDGNTTWDYIVDSTRREYVKGALINDILRWNNACFYEQNGSNFISKHKLVNISEGTLTNHNLSIYPNNDMDNNPAGVCWPSNDCSYVYIDTYQGITHYHSDKWDINFSLTYHQQYGTFSEEILSFVGAHEFGHVLGLVDIDGCENASMSSFHHEELLMGYSYNNYSSLKQKNITYKDLIGAAITRGLHTDDDHQWVYHSTGHGVYKLICAICNGVKYVTSLDGIDYVDYKDCNDEHDLEDGNMFAVASYGDSDYYKCKYCRYVAPFDDIEPQNYSKSQYNSSNHVVTNQVTGLGYSFYEPHTYNDHYNNYNSTQHKAYCECGRYTLMPHVADMSRSYTVFGHTYAPCFYCGAAIEIGGNGPIIPIPGSNDLMVTDNGSYIMPNGIYVIVEEDLEAFLNGTLIFHPYGEVGE